MIPDNIRENVIAKYQQQEGKSSNKLFDYFFTHKLKLLMDSVGDF